MTPRDLVLSLSRQVANAAAWFAGLACVVERLSPGSVLAEIGWTLYLLIIGTVVLFVMLPPEDDKPASSLMSVMTLLPGMVLLCGFAFLTPENLGRSGLVLTAAVGLVCLTAVLAIGFRARQGGRRLFGMVI